MRLRGEVAPLALAPLNVGRLIVRKPLQLKQGSACTFARHAGSDA
jgi:hypothetical protein